MVADRPSKPVFFWNRGDHWGWLRSNGLARLGHRLKPAYSLDLALGLFAYGCTQGEERVPCVNHRCHSSCVSSKQLFQFLYIPSDFPSSGSFFFLFIIPDQIQSWLLWSIYNRLKLFCAVCCVLISIAHPSVPLHSCYTIPHHIDRDHSSVFCGYPSWQTSAAPLSLRASH